MQDQAVVSHSCPNNKLYHESYTCFLLVWAGLQAEAPATAPDNCMAEATLFEGLLKIWRSDRKQVWITNENSTWLYNSDIWRVNQHNNVDANHMDEMSEVTQHTLSLKAFKFGHGICEMTVHQQPG